MTGSAQQVAERLALVRRVEAWVRPKPETGDAPTHGWRHTGRVRRTVLILASVEGVDPVLVDTVSSVSCGTAT